MHVQCATHFLFLRIFVAARNARIEECLARLLHANGRVSECGTVAIAIAVRSQIQFSFRQFSHRVVIWKLPQNMTHCINFLFDTTALEKSDHNVNSSKLTHVSLTWTRQPKIGNLADHECKADEDVPHQQLAWRRFFL